MKIFNIFIKKSKKLFATLNNDTFICSILSVAVITLLIILLCNPTKYNSSITNGLNLFIIAVFPGLFPFMFLTKLLTSLGAVKKMSAKSTPITSFLFNTSGISSYVFILSILSGYPIGAKLISDLYSSEAISHTEAKKMASFCTTSGPIFVIGSVGATMFGSAKIGVILYVSHIVSSIICGIIFAGKRDKQHQHNNALSTKLSMPDNLLGNTIANTVENIFLVGAYITIFFLFTDVLADIGVFSPLINLVNQLFTSVNISPVAEGIIYGILEVTRGCNTLCNSINIWSICFTCSCISFGGLSIILQSMHFFNKCKIKARYFIGIKCVHAILSFFTCMVICYITSPF